jgi:alpha-1,3-rhamnosyl/mannosyltransferase
VHGPNYFLPPGVETGVITVHDLSVFRYPETHPRARLEAFEDLFQKSLARASHVITDTETVRRELINSLSVPAEMVSAIPLGVEPSYRARRSSELAPHLAHWGLKPGGYGLSVAAFEPRKKIAELILAWERLPVRVRERCPLVLAGAAGWQNEALHEKIAKAQSEGWLKHLGYVEEESLPLLYSGARLFIYPSIYEGFGLPPVEAMASGTPVIVANRSCLPEVCGDAARYIDSDDNDHFVDAIRDCLLDEEWQLAAVKRGLARARLYSWERCVEDTVAIYKKALG